MTDWTSLRYAVVDVEGNGHQPPDLVELAVVPIVHGTIGEPRSWLVRPNQPIKAVATRIHGITSKLALRVGLFAASVYTGYFGAASGILVLAVLTPMFERSLVRTNALKNVLSGLANGVAAVGFTAFGPVRWAAAAPLAAGFLLGGWLGPALARRLPGPALRVLAGACGLAVAVKLGLRAYR